MGLAMGTVIRVEEEGNPFAVPDLWKVSSLGTHFDDDDHATTLRLESLHDDVSRDESNVKLRVIGDDLKAGLSLLELPTFEYGPVLEVEVEEVGVLKEDEEVASLEEENDYKGEDEDEDVWTSLQVTESQGQSTNLIKSWEAIYGERVQQARTVYLSDGGGEVYDAALVKSAESATPESTDSISGHVIRSDVILSSLTQLAMGRESVLYRYSEEEKTFRARKNHIRMSGYSLQTFNSLSEALSIHGNRVRDLRAFVAQTYRSSTAFPAHVALAGAFLPILASLEAQIGCPLTPVCSLLQLQALVERPSQVVRCLRDVMVKVRGARTEEELLWRMFELVQSAEYASRWLLSTLQRLLAAVSRPWLESVEGWLGLHQWGSSFTSHSPAFVVPGKREAIADGGTDNESAEFTFEPSAMPSFVSAEDASMIFEIGQNLRLLEKHQPEHLLVKESLLPSDTSSGLEWQFTWRDIENVTTKANKYESSLRKALKDFYSNPPATDSALHSSSQSQKSTHALIDQSTQSTQSFLEISSSAFEAPLPDLYSSPPLLLEDTDIDTGIETYLPFAPPLSLVPALSFTPLISARARLVNNATLRLLFKTHHLRSHLSLLHRFLLLSDSTFTSRLSHALFSHHNDPPSNTSPRSNNNATGLSLNHRSTWPPASFELRLALSGVLADPSSSVLSFAIRPMTPEALTTDPTALQALDFLRLQYNPPPPLNSIVTPASLTAYDGIFTFLLRCLRLRDAVTGLFPPPLKPRWARFRWEAHCFVSCVCAWAFEDCVEGRWRVFEGEVGRVERGVLADDDDDDRHHDGKEGGGGGRDSSIIQLRDLHARFLEDVSASLLMLQPPSPSPLKRDGENDSMMMLEEIFTLVLRFASLVNRHRHRHEEEKEEDEEREREKEISTLHVAFKHRVAGFVDMCRGGVALGLGLGGCLHRNMNLNQDPNRERERERERERDQVGREAMAALVGRLEVAGFGSGVGF